MLTLARQPNVDESLQALDALIAQATPEVLPAILAALASRSLAVSGRLLTEAQRPADPGQDELLDVDEAARITGLSRELLYRSKSLPFKLRVGKRVLFSKLGVAKWINRKLAQNR